MIIDISEQVLARLQYRDLSKSPTVRIKKQMIDWLEENVGDYYKEVIFGGGRAYTGSGWQWGTRSERVDDRFITTWFVEIDDDQLATMFILKFL